MNGQLTTDGKRYYITFINDYSRFYYVCLLSSKDEGLDIFKTYKNEVELHYEKFIKYLRSNPGGNIMILHISRPLGLSMKWQLLIDHNKMVAPIEKIEFDRDC